MEKPKAVTTARSGGGSSKPATAERSDVLTVPEVAGKSRARLIAECAIEPTLRNAHVAKTFASGAVSELELSDCHTVLMEIVARVKDGDLSDIEANLTAQAVTLDAMFTELARRAALNMGTHLGATDTYLRLAMKAQAQCRATAETLAEIKSPRAVAFVRQANIAHGHQQVNNGAPNLPTSTRGRAQARKSETQQSKLLEAGTDGERMDTGTAGTAGGTNPELAPVGALHGAEDGRG